MEICIQEVAVQIADTAECSTLRQVERCLLKMDIYRAIEMGASGGASS